MIKGLFKAFAGTAAAVCLLFSAGLISYAEENTSRFVTGTTVNGIGVSGLTTDEAKEQIEGFYDQGYQLSIREKGGVTETIRGKDIGYHVTVPEGLKAILDEQNATGRKSGPSVDNSHTMEMKAVYDEGALADKIGGLSCISGSSIVVTSDARVSDYQDGEPFTIIPEVRGNNVDPEKTAALIKAAVAEGKKAVDLEAAGCYMAVTVTKDDPQLKAVCEAMNQCRDLEIVYSFGDTEELLTGETVCGWLNGFEDGQVSVNRELAGAWVKALADKYDTAGTVRSFRTAGGKDVELTGPYGWKLDQAAETDALIAMIRTGESQKREPKYAQAASSRALPDWGNTYVEADLTGQHVYMYQDGNLVWEAPCVTGNIAKGHTTPDGIYSLAYKQTDRILRGAKQADGTYEYESHVDYWMPFNGGIGLHDASWRSKFGGTIYKSSGSHGCLNLPPAKAKDLYNLIFKDIPVLCYY